MKHPFRFFRGEFAQSIYIKNIFICLNVFIKDVIDEIVYHAVVQWKLEDEVNANEMAMRDKDIVGIGTIAGLFPVRAVSRTTLGSTYFTPGYVVSGKQRSERGLMNMENESFEFVRTELDDYPNDIANEASPDKRMGYKDSAAAPAGYVPASKPLYDKEGDVIWENVLPSPPTDEAYVPFYGEKYLVHQEFFSKMLPLPVEVYKPLLECCQRIRFNGPTIQEFFNITEIMGQGYIHNVEILLAASNRWYNVYYDLDEYVTIINRERRYLGWLNVCAYKFKLFKLINRNPLQQETVEGGNNVDSE
jgi:hypothetical protein